MVLSYRTVYAGGMGEIEEKKSRFIAETAHVETEEEAFAFLEGIRKRYYDARHHCYAFVLGPDGSQTRCSDDGEPSQTAGKPMLDVLTGSGLTDSIVVVTRYFGGTLLGTGGLVRAYSAAAKAGINASRIIEKKAGAIIRATADYNGVGKLLYLIGQKGYYQLSADYGADVTMRILLPAEERSAFLAELTDAFSGKLPVETEGRVYYAVPDKKPVLYETIPEESPGS